MRVFGFTALLLLVACGGETPTSKPTAKADAPSNSRTSGSENDTSIGEPSDTTDTSEPPSDQPPPSTDTTASATSVNLSWNALGKFVYSLDVKTPDGTWIAPCLDVSTIGSATSVTYKGVCTSADGKAVPKPAAYRLYFSRSDADVQHWQDFVEVTPTASEPVVFKLPTSAPSGVSLNWNSKSATTMYSLDVFLMNGEKVRPCINADGIGSSTSMWFDGMCTAGPSYRRINLKDVKDFVICSAENSDWDHAACSGIPYTGLGTSRTIPN